MIDDTKQPECPRCVRHIHEERDTSSVDLRSSGSSIIQLRLEYTQDRQSEVEDSTDCRHFRICTYDRSNDCLRYMQRSKCSHIGHRRQKKTNHGAKHCLGYVYLLHKQCQWSMRWTGLHFNVSDDVKTKDWHEESDDDREYNLSHSIIRNLKVV